MPDDGVNPTRSAIVNPIARPSQLIRVCALDRTFTLPLSGYLQGSDGTASVW
jgi:hypothetical protein